MSAPAKTAPASYGALLGHSAAAAQATKTMHETSSALIVLAGAMDQTPEDEADRNYALWADTIRTISRALHHEALVADGWLKMKGDAA